MALKEVAIAVRDFGPGRAAEGEVIVVRKPLSGIGNREGVNYLWFLMDEEDLPEALPSKVDGRPVISLDELKAANPELDLDKCRCTETWYQPFFDTCPMTCKHRDLRERPQKVKLHPNIKVAMNGKLPNQRGK